MARRRQARVQVKDAVREGGLFRARLIQAGALLVVALLALVARYAWLQLSQHEEFVTRSESNRIKLRPVAPARGLVYDRNGVLLADNRPAFRIEVVPERVADLEATLSGLAGLLVLDDDDLERFRAQYAAARRFQPVPLKFNLGEEEMARFAVNQHRFPGVDVVSYHSRHYVHGALYSHIIGYVGRIDADDQARLDGRRYAGSSHTGKTGLERHYEDLLHGHAGLEHVETHAAGRPLRVVSRTPPRAGRHLYLSLDHRLQSAMAAAFEGESGAAMAVDPRSGEVLGMVSLPGFDPNPFVGGISRRAYAELVDSPDRPLFNRVVQGGYEPGSTLKPLLVVAGLELGVIRAGDRVLSTGQYQLPGHSQVYRDWRAGGHGQVDAREAIAQSVNTYFYRLAVDIGIDRMAAFMGRFGFGERTGLDVIGEARGVLPSREWKQATLREPWYLGETVIAGIGQGYWVTTMPQLAQSMSILARRGRHAPLHLLRATQDGIDGEPIPVPGQAASELPLGDAGHWEVAVQGMVDVVHGATGTARAIGQGAPYRIAGKTGTAQRVSRREGRNPDSLARHLRNQALFVAFAPAEDPAIVLVVVIEGGGSGSRAAAPIARRILDAWWAIGRELQP
ncbi:MAG: penicillin-binding protein 2 [Pseudoxanthomonas sp.]|nr:penicillin-binding protein 2 [Pseudoxanthomonas sp.]